MRCERCRAVFRLDPPASPTVVQCQRCQHVFQLPDHDIIAFRPVGELGGAAVLVRDPLAQAHAPRHLARPPRRSASSYWRLAFLLLAMVALVVVSAVMHRPAARSHAPPAEPLSFLEGERLLRLDDETSLVQAISQFEQAESLDPANVDGKADRAFATLLLGATLREEADDLLGELSRVTLTAESLAALDASDRARAVQHAGELRQKLPELTARADSTVKEGLALAHALEKRAVDPSVFTQRALWLADAFERRLDRLKAPTMATRGNSRLAPLESEQLAWWHFARGFAFELGDSQHSAGATVEKELVAAVSLDPSNIRASAALAKLLQGRAPPDPRVAGLVKRILALNPHHEGALRLVALAEVADAGER